MDLLKINLAKTKAEMELPKRMNGGRSFELTSLKFKTVHHCRDTDWHLLQCFILQNKVRMKTVVFVSEACDQSASMGQLRKKCVGGGGRTMKTGGGEWVLESVPGTDANEKGEGEKRDLCKVQHNHFIHNSFISSFLKKNWQKQRTSDRRRLENDNKLLIGEYRGHPVCEISSLFK